jgi:hypothetical protein
MQSPTTKVPNNLLTGTNRPAAKTSPEEFVFWLRGLLASGQGFQTNGMDAETTVQVSEKLASVFTHVPAKAPRTPVERWQAPISTLPPKGQCQEPGECRGVLCDNPNCPTRLEAMC